MVHIKEILKKKPNQADIRIPSPAPLSPTVTHSHAIMHSTPNTAAPLLPTPLLASPPPPANSATNQSPVYGLGVQEPRSAPSGSLHSSDMGQMTSKPPRRYTALVGRLCGPRVKIEKQGPLLKTWWENVVGTKLFFLSFFLSPAVSLSLSNCHRVSHLLFNVILTK